jgi:hypothetical protein
MLSLIADGALRFLRRRYCSFSAAAAEMSAFASAFFSANFSFIFAAFSERAHGADASG